MKIKLLAALAALGMSGSALAYVECTPTNPASFKTETLYATSDIIKLRADAPIGQGKYIGRANSPALSTVVIYNCLGDTIYASRPVDNSLTPYENYPNMYRTNIEGIGVKFVATPPGGDAGAELPMPPYFAGAGIPGTSSSNITANQGRFVAYFYKLSDNINLSKPNTSENLLYSKKNVGYNKIEDTTVSVYAIENIYIVGIPVCTVDNPLPVDFGTVSATDVRRGVEKTFSFGINCKTDYGDYDVTASINAENSADGGKYIKVTDDKGKTDSLIIEINDEQNKSVMVDDSTKLTRYNIKSGQPANFTWKAKLRKPDGKEYPAQGPFTALAIITLEIK